MTSMRQLHRRLLRWRRYVAKTTGGRRRYGWEFRRPPGHVRAMLAANAEWSRRWYGRDHWVPPIVDAPDVSTWEQP
jgi:hypothetical protein